METNCSIVDVARVAKVGIGTVSRVLNHAPNVHPDTAALVLAAVAKLGYRLPNKNNRRGPRSSRRPTQPRAGAEILMAVLGRQGLDWVLQCAPVYAGVLHGIESATADNGYLLTIRQAPNWSQLATNLESNLPEGMIVLGFEKELGSRNSLPTAMQQIPAVWTMGSPIEFRGDHVQPNHFKIGMIAAEYLLERKHIHCAGLGTCLGSPASLQGYRNDSFQWVIEQAGGTAKMFLDPNLVKVEPGLHEVDGAILNRLIDRILQSSPRPTALFLESDVLAPVVYQRLAIRGVAPQEDIDIITCNNERPYLAPLSPKPAVIDIQPQIIGRRAVDQLLWRSANRHSPAIRMMVEPILVPFKS